MQALRTMDCSGWGHSAAWSSGFRDWRGLLDSWGLRLQGSGLWRVVSWVSRNELPPSAQRSRAAGGLCNPTKPSNTDALAEAHTGD